jgi:hypothetical protein
MPLIAGVKKKDGHDFGEMASKYLTNGTPE